MAHQSSPVALEIKGDLFPLMVLRILHWDVEAVVRDLISRQKLAPNLFHQAPVALDLNTLASEPNVDDILFLETLVKRLRACQLVVIGLYRGTPNQQQVADRLGLLPSLQKEISAEKIAASPPPSQHHDSARIVCQPVRSGQQIYAREQDLILLASVSPGAEVMADGHIHAYASLRGKALAGVRGNQHAQIFCNSLEAELIGIAGCYRLFEYYDAWNQQAVRVFLEDEQLKIVPFQQFSTGR